MQYRHIVLSATAVLLVSCGTITTQSHLEGATTQATGYERGTYSIDSIKTGFMGVSYRVHVDDGTEYACEVQGVGPAIISSALCTEMKITTSQNNEVPATNKKAGKTAKNGNTENGKKAPACNDLLKAAGRC